VLMATTARRGRVVRPECTVGRFPSSSSAYRVS
jgi:hypothetical protein